MRKLLLLSAMMFAFVAQTHNARAQNFEMKDATYSAFAKGLFTEVTTTTGPTKFIFVAGIGAENEDGSIAHQGNFLAQCVMAYEKIKTFLAANDATLDNIVKGTTYVTDIRYFGDLIKCRNQVFPSARRAPGTLLQVSGFARPGMLIEIDVTAAVAAK